MAILVIPVRGGNGMAASWVIHWVEIIF